MALKAIKGGATEIVKSFPFEQGMKLELEEGDRVAVIVKDSPTDSYQYNGVKVGSDARITQLFPCTLPSVNYTDEGEEIKKEEGEDSDNKKSEENSDEEKSEGDEDDDNEDDEVEENIDKLLRLLPAFHTSNLEGNAVNFKVGKTISPTKFVIVIYAKASGKHVGQENFEFKILEFADEKSGHRGDEKTYLEICGEHLECHYVVHHFDIQKL